MPEREMEAAARTAAFLIERMRDEWQHLTGTELHGEIEAIIRAAVMAFLQQRDASPEGGQKAR